MKTTIYIVTPCMNAASTIDRTIHSVVSQAGDFRIRYHIQDGGSSDGTQARIEVWKKRLSKGDFPRHCRAIHLTYASEQDRGMYDGLVKAFTTLNAGPNDFMTWINSDDILMPGAMALASALGQQFTKEQLSWFGGAACIIHDDLVTTTFDRPVPSEAIRLGLCDGIHWDFIQQEGTFFRNWLWRSINPIAALSQLKLAGDWNLWRLMASNANLAQVTYPLGGFRVSENQLSLQRANYMAEIDSILYEKKRRRLLETLCSERPVIRERIQTVNFRSSHFRIVEESIDSYAKQRYFKVFQKHGSWEKREQPREKMLYEFRPFELNPISLHSEVFPKMASLEKRKDGLVALDEDWQFPAITEKHAFVRMSSLLQGTPPGIIYVAYPWATLIDKVQTEAIDASLHLDRFEQFCDLLPKGIPKVTVCQHIYGRKFEHYFSQAGIDHIFWSHTTHNDVAHIRCDKQGPYFYPFPLYPVQVARAFPGSAPEMDLLSRRYLFSFAGARANKHYLSDARNWILDYLAEDLRGHVVGRDSWHYEKLVYDLQIKGTAEQANAEQLMDASDAEQFRELLKQSTFSLCPSGSGPNSIRLWESIGAGSIPVILADTWAPPGDARLWEMAAVFCKEDPDEIKTLPERLAKIASDPEQLASMRHAMRQLWLLYGPDSFVTDIQEFMLSHPEVSPHSIDTQEGKEGEPTWSVIDAALCAEDGASLLRHCSPALLLDPARILKRIQTDTRLGEGLGNARKDRPHGSDLLRHYDAVLALARRKVELSSLASPSIIRKSVPNICLFGRHASRTPLSYEPIRRLIGQRLNFVETPAQADIVISGFNIDLRDNIESLLPVLSKTNKPKFAVLSEEPLWDITWSGPFTGREARISAKGAEIAYTFLSHETSDIYEFERIPYFVLTSDSYAVRYANLMARFAGMKSKDMLDRWQRVTVPAAFFLEKRTGDAYASTFPERDVAGLSAYRTEVAENTHAPGVLRVGKGWSSEARRQDLPDWHLDKLAQIDGRTRVLSAFENVHQRLYITEKIFDAFAVGAVPAYWAGPKHRVFELTPEASMLNCHDLSPQEAADKINRFVPDIPFAEAWLDTTARLAALFRDGAAIRAERRRVAEATLQNVLALA